MDERVRRLEEKMAYLERHVVEQDKAMLELTEQLARLRLAPDDMVLISDCDEIPRRGFVGMLHALPPDGIAVARQTFEGAQA